MLAGGFWLNVFSCQHVGFWNIRLRVKKQLWCLSIISNVLLLPSCGILAGFDSACICGTTCVGFQRTLPQQMDEPMMDVENSFCTKPALQIWFCMPSLTTGKNNDSNAYHIKSFISGENLDAGNRRELLLPKAIWCEPPLASKLWILSLQLRVLALLDRVIASINCPGDGLQPFHFKAFVLLISSLCNEVYANGSTCAVASLVVWRSNWRTWWRV